jgi:hypothetical protein
MVFESCLADFAFIDYPPAFLHIRNIDTQIIGFFPANCQVSSAKLGGLVVGSGLLYADGKFFNTNPRLILRERRNRLEKLKARLEEGFIGGFLVLAVVIFLAGFLMGMLAIAMIPAEANETVRSYLVFTFGFVSGMTIIALVWVVLRLKEFTKAA